MIALKQNVFVRKPCPRCKGVSGDYTCKYCDGWGETLHDRRMEATARTAGICLLFVLLGILAALVVG